jgi:hypothetical protein
MIKKVAQPPWWPKVMSGVKKVTNLPPEVRSLIDAPNRLVWHQATPPGADSMAKGFVTTEDKDQDGNLDTVNLVVTNMEREIPPELLAGINQMDEKDPAFQDIVSNTVKTLVHELAHIEDYDPERGFPGGEPVAESREKSFNPIFAHSTTNKIIGNDSIIKLNSKGELKMTKDIIKLANHLDRIGHKDLADRLDSILKAAQELPSDDLDLPAMTETEKGEQPAEESTGDCGTEGCITSPTGIVFSLGHKCLKDKENPDAGVKDCYQILSIGKSKAPGIEQWEGKFFSEDHMGLMQELYNARDWVAQQERMNAAEQTGVAGPGSTDLVGESDDYLAAGETTQDKINKLAELMSGELSSGTPGSFYRR